MKYSATMFFVMTAALCLFSEVAAQNNPPPPPPPFGGPGSTKFEQFKKMRMIEYLKLDEETSVRFIARYNKFLEQMREAGKHREELIDKLEESIKGKASDDELNKALKDIEQNEEQLIDLKNEFVQRLRDILTVRQVAAYVAFERKFNHDIRDVMREMTRENADRRRND